MGRRELNLVDYIGKGPKWECLRLDDNRQTQFVYLTVMVHVSDDNEEGDDDEMMRQAEETTLAPSKFVQEEKN